MGTLIKSLSVSNAATFATSITVPPPTAITHVISDPILSLTKSIFFLSARSIVTETDLFARKRNKFLSGLVTAMYPELDSLRHQSCLMFLPETNWKWCWCVAEAATLKYVGQLSERFDTAIEAEQWIRAQVE